MIKADFSFIEYSYNSAETDLMEVERGLDKLGFACRAHHNSENTTLWTQGLCIILVRDTPNVDVAGISGIGFMSNQHTIEHFECEYDPTVEMYVTHDLGGNRILFFPDSSDNLGDMLDGNYIINNLELNHKEVGFSSFSGLVINGLNRFQMDFYQELGFKFTKSADSFNTLVSKNNRFIVKVDKRSNSQGIKGLVIDCDDVFITTSKLHIGRLDLMKFEHKSNYDAFGKHVHKIFGYNCVAVGNENSYSIENFCIDPLPGMDISFRSRKQFLDISDNLLEMYYNG